MPSLRDADSLAQSPYRVRGALYLGTRSYFESQVTGGFEALCAALRPALCTFMSQPFERDAFYEVMDAPELIDVEARVCGLSVPRYLDRRTRWQAQRDLSGLAGVVLRLLPPAYFVGRVVRTMTDTFNFGAAQVTKLEARWLHVAISGVPARLVPWLEHSVGVYGRAGAEGAGLRAVEVRALPPARSPDGPGVKLQVDVRWGVSE